MFAADDALSALATPAHAVTAKAAPFADDAARWAAVGRRDPAADGAFVFAVRTTGVYCRPSCPARMPKRENVTFHADGAAARRRGFRACKRCRPDVAREDSVEVQAATAAARLIDAAIAAEEAAPPLRRLADRAGYSPYHFHRMFKRVIGVTPKAYAAQLRSRRMEAELKDSPSVTDAIHGAGYSSSSRFYETATARLGMAPSARRAGGAGETIRHAVASTTLGLLLVAATERGVCAIQFGNEAEALERGLAERFPRARIVPSDADFADLVAKVVALVEEPGRGHGLPLDIRGTAFQEQVWKALQAIPPGRTASYAEIAEAIGRPEAVRGVAQACAANPAAVAVPCHRVVRSDGALSGYRWGVERKAALLAREGAR